MGNVKVYREFKCPLDDFDLLAFSTGVKGRSYPFCPYCYNHPPFSDMPHLGGCNTCTHSTCPHSLNTLGISSCGECPAGVLVLDCTLAPTWKLGCNRCDVIINCFKGATKITVEGGYRVYPLDLAPFGVKPHFSRFLQRPSVRSAAPSR